MLRCFSPLYVILCPYIDIGFVSSRFAQGGFGKFCVVLLAFSVMANIVGSLYAVSLNCQMFLPPLIHVPRPVFVIIVTAV